ncbi:MAG: glycosyltransferase family 4 protein [Chitinophagaceae bacterium]|nr:glycosyltransferase family 4 protein [Chitinophagaceae bacterium]
MRILIVTQYFWPENFRINDLALGLLERGHQVTVLTGVPNYPDGSFFKGFGYFNKQQEYHGVKVVRVPLISRGKGGGIRLALNYISFAVAASILGPLLCKGKFDQIFVFEPSPITVGIPALIFKKLKSAPLLFWVQDLWPESLSATGAVKSKKVLALVASLVRFIYQRCDRILIQAKSFSNSIQRQGGARDRIFFFPNSAENLFTAPSSAATPIPPLPEGFKIMFAGNIGAAQDFETIIAAAERLKGYKDIHWVIVGDGRMRGWSETEVKARGLSSNVHFMGRHPLEAMPAFFLHADALLVTLKKEPIFALTIPSKIQSYLACGRPVVAALDGEGANIIEEAGAGFTCPAGAPEALAQAVLRMHETSEAERKKMGASGREYYEANFDREMLLDRLDGWMRELVAGT